jgi:serine/threonine-protein kinase PknK
MGVGPGVTTELAAGAYVAKRLIGRGASGEVWLCTHASTGRRAALKIGLSSQQGGLLADEGLRLLLADAARVPSFLDAGIVSVEGPGGAAQRPFIVLEWIQGASPVRGDADPDPASLLGIARDVGLALADLHLAGVAHGDVKPENIVVGRDTGRARASLVDLGLAEPITTKRVRAGTPRYLAPEGVDGSLLGDARARDLWALGLTLAELASPAVARSPVPLEVLARTPLPEPIGSIVVALLSRAPSARPSASWVHRAASDALGVPPEDSVARRRARVRRAYLAAHHDTLRSAAAGQRMQVDVAGIAGEWLADAVQRLGKLAALRGSAWEAPERPPIVLRELDALGRAAYLQGVIESPVAHWPLDDIGSDTALIERLLSWSEHAEPRALTYAALLNSGQRTPPRPALRDPVVLALALGGTRVEDHALESAEAWTLSGNAPAEAVLAAGRALRRVGAVGRARAVLSRLQTSEGLLEAAETARRSGDRALAADTAARALALDPSASIQGRLRALSARLRLDAGDIAAAESLLSTRADTAAEFEVLGLLRLQQGRPAEALSATARGYALAQDDEERARLHAVTGNAAHALGDARTAFGAFRLAAEHATRAGAVLEEATYLTGVAASAFDSGRLGEAIAAAQRSALLFEHLGRPGESGRATLARAAVYACVGAVTLAGDAARAAIRWARLAGDERCRAFAHLVLADTLMASERAEAREHAERALGLLDEDPGARLRALARLLEAGGSVDIGRGDALATVESTPVAARLEWWTARARTQLDSDSPRSASGVLTGLHALATVPAPLPTRGPALATGALLAARVGDGDLARRLAAPAAEAARLLIEGAPAELRAAAEAMPWATALSAPTGDTVSAAQLREIEALVRSLGTRDRLAPLLAQVLDALVLWSGVERGLLLLRAPGGRLVPRAARNLAREDLVGPQLALSTTLAERALTTAEPVVAVDATGELSEVHESVHALRLRSVLAVPLIARGEALGVVYLDDRVRSGAFGPPERSWARLVAAIAAVAIADARDQLLLRRAARRARRAERRLAEELAHREAELGAAQAELARARGARNTRFDYTTIAGQSPAVTGMLQIVDRVAASEVPVLVTGESGSGKELVARAIHDHGPRRKERFVTENCGAIPEGLLESTLFGHVRGAFTGASRPRVGLFEVADGGTLFLDEVGEMSLGMQAKLLRVLEDGEVKPVGSERARKVSVRVIAATHRDLAKMVEAGTFRQDLYYRLNVIAVRVPPLRERVGDVEVLARHFVHKHSGGRGRLSKNALAALAAYDWPGNIRQLENEIRRALVLADELIEAGHLSREVREGPQEHSKGSLGLDLRRHVDALEGELVRRALARTGGNQTRAAELLGLSRFGLQKMIKRLGIDISGLGAPVTGEG